MKQITNSTFNEGLVSDLNPLTTPQTCLSDCVNGTLITFNGNEFTLQSDNGNVKLKNSEIKPGYIPVGAKEYGGILYLALLNPLSGDCEIGSIPSPDFDKTPKDAQNGININFQAKPGSYSKLIKLFEQDQMLINPGDLYKITETGEKPPLYKYNYKVLDTNENIFKLNNPNKTNEFKPFNQTLAGTLGLEISLNNINYFDAYSIVDGNTLKIHYFGENKLQGVGSEDDIYIKSIQYKFFTNEGSLIRQENIDLTDKTETVRGLHQFEIDETWGKEFKIQIIPESNFEQLSNLLKVLEINLSEKTEIKEGNSLFKYYFNDSSKSLRLEFDYNFEPTDETQIYVEFYDLWSDYSIVYFVEDPNPFGKNIIFLDTTNEKLLPYRIGTNVSEDGSIGGIPENEITSKSSNDILPLLTNNIRTKQQLRENNFYVCAIHKVINGVIKDTIKKPFVLNTFLNDSFYKDDVLDMTKLTNKQIDINTKTNISVKTQQTQFKTRSGDTLTLFTNKEGNKYYYQLTDRNLVGTEPGDYYDEFETSVKLEIKNVVDSVNSSYGLIELSNLNEAVELDPSTEVVGSKDGHTLEFVKSNNFFDFKLRVLRTINAKIGSESRMLRFHDKNKDVFLWSKLYSNQRADINSPGIELVSNSRNDKFYGIQDYATKTQLYMFDSGDNDPLDDAQIKHFGENVMQGKYSGFITKFDQSKFGSQWNNWNKERMADIFGPEQANYFLIMYCIREDSDYNYIIVPYTNKQDVIDIFNNIYTPLSVEDKPIYLNYYTDVEDNGEYETFVNGNVLINIEATPESIQYYKKHGNFVKSNYIEILNDLGIEFNDNYLNIDTSNFEYSTVAALPKLSITASVDPLIKNKILNGLSDLERQESDSLISSELTVGNVYSKNRKWDKIATKFIWENTSSRFKLKLENWSLMRTYFWNIGGSHSYGKENNECIDYANNYFLNSF